jgi:DNA-3-methyladenine glycosylase I
VRPEPIGAHFFFWPRQDLKLTAKRSNSSTTSASPKVVRCRWASNDLNIPYHDEEWGVPVHDDRTWFEFLTLEGAQAGLSWDTVLRKRERYKEVFAGFDAAKVAHFDREKIKQLMADPGIIRNRLKIESTISNARAFLQVQKEFGSFDAYIWEFVGGSPIRNKWRMHQRLPAETPLAAQISKDLKKRGFRFVGPTICYAMMQATGLVNDHLVSCFRYTAVSAQLKSRSAG